MAISLVEKNETGEEVATYVSSRTDDRQGRIDLIVSRFTLALPDTLVLDRLSHGAPHYYDLLFQAGTIFRPLE